MSELFDSVPPDVKTISRASTPRTPANRARASASFSSACLPAACGEEGLAK